MEQSELHFEELRIGPVDTGLSYTPEPLLMDQVFNVTLKPLDLRRGIIFKPPRMNPGGGVDLRCRFQQEFISGKASDANRLWMSFPAMGMNIQVV
jgi:hypothetical protein